MARHCVNVVLSLSKKSFTEVIFCIQFEGLAVIPNNNNTVHPHLSRPSVLEVVNIIIDLF